MLTIPVVNPKGEKISTIEIDPSDFGGEVRQQLLHDVVVMHLANSRQGTASTKRRGEVAGAKKKLLPVKRGRETPVSVRGVPTSVVVVARPRVPSLAIIRTRFRSVLAVSQREWPF